MTRYSEVVLQEQEGKLPYCVTVVEKAVLSGTLEAKKLAVHLDDDPVVITSNRDRAPFWKGCLSATLPERLQAFEQGEASVELASVEKPLVFPSFDVLPIIVRPGGQSYFVTSHRSIAPFRWIISGGMGGSFHDALQFGREPWIRFREFFEELLFTNGKEALAPLIPGMDRDTQLRAIGKNAVHWRYPVILPVRAEEQSFADEISVHWRGETHRAAGVKVVIQPEFNLITVVSAVRIHLSRDEDWLNLKIYDCEDGPGGKPLDRLVAVRKLGGRRHGFVRKLFQSGQDVFTSPYTRNVLETVGI
ncbi:MAG: hypothetical protein AAB562_01535 [Patescibacteria group bacterium]